MLYENAHAYNTIQACHHPTRGQATQTELQKCRRFVNVLHYCNKVNCVWQQVSSKQLYCKRTKPRTCTVGGFSVCVKHLLKAS